MIRRTRGEVVGDAVIYATLVVANLLILYPFYYTLINSINGDLLYGPALLWPSSLSTYSYKLILSNPLLVNSFFITVARTVVGLGLTAFNCAMVGFVLRKKNILFRKFYIAFLLIPMFFQGGLIPMYLNFKRLMLLDNFLVFILPRFFRFFYLVIFMSCFNDMSDSLEESAKIDGAGYFTIFIRIYFPLSLPILATVCLFEGVEQWNSWFDSVYFTNSPRLVTLPAFLIRIIKEADLMFYKYDIAKEMGNRNIEGLKLAVMIITVAPITLIYPFFQRYFIRGIMLGSLKG